MFLNFCPEMAEIKWEDISLWSADDPCVCPLVMLPSMFAQSTESEDDLILVLDCNKISLMIF